MNKSAAGAVSPAVAPSRYSGSAGVAASSARSGPFLSVLVICFNRRQYLLEAVRSVVGQSCPRSAFEILVLKNFMDPDIDRELRQLGATGLLMGGTGQGGWLAQSLETARGNVFAFLDDDDLFLPDKLSAVTHEFANRPALGYYHNGHRRLGASNSTSQTAPASPLAGTTGDRLVVEPGVRSRATVEALWRSGAAFNLSSVSVRRELLESSRSLLSEVQLSTPAFLFFGALSSPCAILSDNRVLTGYRVHRGNVSGTVASSEQERWSREVSRAPRMAVDCEVILRLLAHRSAPRPMGRHVRVAKRRNQVLASIGADPFSRRDLVRRMLQLGVVSIPGQLRASGPHLRLGFQALLLGH
jgi:glycosyltransferase involved in cell wall biosynthesis